MAVAPRDLVVGPLDVYLAPVGESFPAVDATPAGNWALLGTHGDESYGEDGITISHPETIEKFRTVGSTGARKAVRTEEDLRIELVLQDLTFEEFAKVLNDVTVQSDAGPPSIRKLPLRRGRDVARYAFLARGEGMSPYGAFNVQLQVPIVYVAAAPAPVFGKGDVASLAVAFEALEDPSAATAEERFGFWVAQVA